MVPKEKKTLELGCIVKGQRGNLVLALGNTQQFQAEVYTMKVCAVENLDRDCKNRNIYILSHSQATFKALGKYQITSKLVWIATNRTYSWPDITELN
jgi:hypothetical protein